MATVNQVGRNRFVALGFDEKTGLPKSSTITPQGLAGKDYNPAQADQQKQLLAASLGLDLNLLQQFSQNPNAFKQQYGQYFDPKTNKFTIPDVTPGALIGAPQGPNGTVLAAGSTPTNPLDLKGVTSSAVQPGSVTFLPPYLQPGNQPTSAAPAPTLKFQTIPDRPINPAANGLNLGTPQKLNRPNAGIQGPLDFPAYLRSRKPKTNPVAYG